MSCKPILYTIKEENCTTCAHYGICENTNGCMKRYKEHRDLGYLIACPGSSWCEYWTEKQEIREMKEFKDIFPKTDFAMDAVISAAIEESADLDKEHREALFVTVISGVAMMAGTAMNGNFGQGTFGMDDANVGHNLLIQSVKRFLPTAIRLAEDEMEGLA